MINAYQTYGEGVNSNHSIEESNQLNEDLDDEEISIDEQMEYFKTPKFSIDSQVALLPSSGHLSFPQQVLFSFAKNSLVNNQQHSTPERPSLAKQNELEYQGQEFQQESDNQQQFKNKYPHPYAFYNYLSHNINDRVNSKQQQPRQLPQHSQQRIPSKNPSRCLNKSPLTPSEITIKPDSIINLAGQNIINLNNSLNQRHKLHKRPRTNSSTLSEKENIRSMVPQNPKQVSNLFVKDTRPVSPIQHRPKVLPSTRQAFNDSFSIQAHGIFNDNTNNTSKQKIVQNSNKRMTPPLFLHKQQVLQRKQQQQQQQLLEPLKPICQTLGFQKNSKINSNNGSTVTVIPAVGHDSFDGLRSHCKTQPLEEMIMNQNSFHHHHRELSNRSIKTASSSKPSSAKNSKPPLKLNPPLPQNAQISLFQPLFISNPNSIFAPQLRTNTLS